MDKPILNCAECTKTNNHCCKADIPYSAYEAVYMKYLATEKYKLLDADDIYIGPHPNANISNMFVVFSTKGLNPDVEVDLQKMSCMFFNETTKKCNIYEDRPFVCKSYGTEFIRCRFDDKVYSAEEIESFNIFDGKLDSQAYNRSYVAKTIPE